MNYKANQQYQANRKEFEQAVQAIQQMIDSGLLNENPETVHWGHVGDMGRFAELATELAEVVTGNPK